MLKPEEFVDTLHDYWAHTDKGVVFLNRAAIAEKITARDAEVREEKRKEVVAEIEVSTTFTDDKWPDIGPLLSKRGILLAKSLQPPPPKPSERAMRVASRNLHGS